MIFPCRSAGLGFSLCSLTKTIKPIFLLFLLSLFNSYFTISFYSEVAGWGFANDESLHYHQGDLVADSSVTQLWGVRRDVR